MKLYRCPNCSKVIAHKGYCRYCKLERKNERYPKVSIVMTVYNGEKYIEKCLASIFEQRYDNLEVVIINDGSTDKTNQIIKMYLNEPYYSKRIIYYEMGENRGADYLHEAMNKGLDLATGDYIARIDSDDVMLQWRIKKQVEYLQKNPDIFMVGTSCELIDKEGKIIGKIIKKPLPPWIQKYALLRSNSLIHSSIMFRKTKLRYPNRHEHLFYLNCLLHGKKIVNLRKPYVQYRVHDEGLIAKNNNGEMC